MRKGRWQWISRMVGRFNQLAPSGAPAEVRRVTPEELEQALIAGRAPVLIDIRSAEAFAGAHLPGAIRVPLNELSDAAERLDRSAPTVVY